MFPRTDADGRDPNRVRDLFGKIANHNFQNNRERTRFFHGARIGDQRFGFRSRPAFHFVAAFFSHTLRQHPDVSHERNARAGDRFNLGNVAGAAFELHPLRANIDKLFRRRQSLLGCVVGANRHVGDEQGALDATRHRARVMQHLFERHARGVFIPEHHHAQRIAHQDNIDPTFIEQARRRIIVSRQRGNFLATLFHFSKIFH